MRDQQQQRSGLADFIFGQMRDAVAEIRDKLVFEGWFGGRSHNPGSTSLGQQWTRPTIHDRTSFEEQWAVRSPAERGPDAKGPEIDR